MKKLNLLLFLCGILAQWSVCQGQYHIIPQPQLEFYGKVGIPFTSNLSFSVNSAGDNLKLFLKDIASAKLEKGSGKTVKIEFIKDTKIANEGYNLSHKAGKIKVISNGQAGEFYALQTLRQILLQSEEKGQIDEFEIKDQPEFGWRGLMLDVSRHFFGVEDVKRYIDVMSRYKYNVLHWHLTDDEGWRIEIKKYPKLTQVGAWRAEGIGRYGIRKDPKFGESTPYGGYYTQDQIKDIIAYAENKNIRIVPEIDVPGHSMALLAAYPELSTKDEPKMVSNGFKFSEWYGNGTFKMLVENTIDPSDEKVYDFLNNVMTEVASLFPGKYIHIGGDEAYHGYWEEDSNVKALMKKENLKNSEEVQSYFMKRMEKIISSKGKTMIGWDEILYGGLAEGAAVMSWRGMKGGIEAAKAGHEVVMSPTTYCYLDYTQGDPSIENAIYASLSLKKTYEFNPLPEGVDKKYILGGQGNVWTEQIPTIDHAFMMTYPRALSIIESVWSGEKNKNWNKFTSKLDYAINDLERSKIAVSRAYLEPEISVSSEDGALRVNATSSVPNVEVRYTTDHTLPMSKSKLASGNIDLAGENTMLKVASFRNGLQIGRTISLTKEELKKRIKK
jgi:hexosaminidase